MAVASASCRVVGRYVVHGEIASGGMGAVHFGRLVGSAGFHRVVAIKRLHPQHARDPEVVASFVDEARLASRIRHPNVAATLDVVQEASELLVVMEYVHGESLARLGQAARRLGEAIPPRVAAAIACGALHGLEAAHRATSETGAPLGLVHRDVSPENILVGVDGVPRVVDFGVALAEGRSQVTREGRLKGKLAYMAPELFDGERATARSDVYSAGVVLWEALTGTRLFTGDNEGAILRRILRGDVAPPSAVAEGLSLRADAIVLRALARAPADRHASALDLARAIEDGLPLATPAEVGAWVRRVAERSLEARSRALEAIERSPLPRAGQPEALPGPTPGADRGASRPTADDAEAPTTVLATPARPREAQTPPRGATAFPPAPVPLAAPPSFGLPGSVAPGLPSSSAPPRQPLSPLPPDPCPPSNPGPVFGESPANVPFPITANAMVAPRRAAPEIAPSGPSRRRIGAIALGIPFGLAALGLLARVAVTPGTSAAGRAEPVAAAIPAPTARPAEATATTPPSPEPSATSSAAPAPRPPPASSALAPRPPRSGKPSTPGNNCNPPYTVDDKGIHHFKPSCM